MKDISERYVLKKYERVYNGAITKNQYENFIKAYVKQDITVADYSENDLEQYMKDNDIIADETSNMVTDEQSENPTLDSTLKALTDKLCKKYNCRSLYDLVNYLSGDVFLPKYKGAGSGNRIPQNQREYIPADIRKQIVNQAYANDSDISALFAELMSGIIGRTDAKQRSIYWLIENPLSRVANYYGKGSKGSKTDFLDYNENIRRNDKDYGVITFSDCENDKTGLLSTSLEAAASVTDNYNLPSGWFEKYALDSPGMLEINNPYGYDTRLEIVNKAYESFDCDCNDYEHQIIRTYLQGNLKTKKDIREHIGLTESKFKTQLQHIRQKCGAPKIIDKSSRGKSKKPKKVKTAKDNTTKFASRLLAEIEAQEQRGKNECGKVIIRQATPEELERYREMIKRQKIFQS